jgi:hypothetical protein
MAILSIVPSAQLNFSTGFYLIQIDFMQSMLSIAVRITSLRINTCRMASVTTVTFSTTALRIMTLSVSKFSLTTLSITVKILYAT